MTDLNGLDPIVVAALIDDEDDEESKALTKKALEQDSQTEDDDDGEDEVDTDKKTEAEDDKTDTGLDKPAEDDATTPPEDDTNPKDDTKTEEPKKSRAERRAERQQAFIEKIGINPNDDVIKPVTPQYKPLEIKPDGEYEPDALIEDRENYARAQAQQAAERQRAISEETNFWNATEIQAKTIVKDEKFAFLDDKNPETFDADRAAKINNLYLKVIGYKETPMINDQGLAKVDAQGNVVKLITTARKDLPYDDFVREYMETVEDFVDDNTAATSANLVKQKAMQGVRPGGGSRHGISKLKIGDISKMNQEDFEKNEAEIDRKINAGLGL